MATTPGAPDPMAAENPYAAPVAPLRADPGVSRAASAAAASLCHGLGLMALLTFWIPVVGLWLSLTALGQARRVWTPEHRGQVRLGTAYAAIALVLSPTPFLLLFLR